MNGEFINWADANVHVMAHALHYGSSVFEGIRCYPTESGRAIFRLKAHIQRLLDSARLYRMPMDYDAETLSDACRQVIVKNELPNAYIRPLIYRGFGTLSVIPEASPVETMIGAIEWGNYLGEEGLTNGIDVCVSSWSRTDSSSIPVLSKAGGHYLNAQLIGWEARRNGYDEGISVSATGMISEGSAENIFLVRQGTIYTPPLAAAILGGITRDSVIQLARDLGYEVIEQSLPRELLYLADEVFLTGTAAEVTPVRSVDRIPVGNGSRGPVTEKLQDAFFGLFRDRDNDKYEWLDFVE